MKVLSTEGLTKLIQLIKSSFISVNNTVTTNTVTLAAVATSGDFEDLINQPTIPDTSNLANKDLSNLSSTGDSKFQEPLVSGTNIKTINNQSILGSGDLSIPIPTAISDLTDDTSTNPIDKAESVADQRDSSSLKYWTGTKAQYDAIATKDSDTIYNVEDTTSPIVDILNTLYPIGAIYIGTMATCPLSVLGIGTWQLVAQDRVLQGAGTRGTVGSEIDESLPNIKGYFADNITGANGTNITGAFYSSGTYPNAPDGNAGSNNGKYVYMNLDASRSSSTYQDNAPVQQDGYLVNIWERTA